MQTLSIEGAKDGIHVNCLAPTAATRMTEGLLPPAMRALLAPGAVTPGLLVLASREAPSRAILCAGAGSFARAYVTLTEGIHVAAPTRPSASRRAGTRYPTAATKAFRKAARRRAKARSATRCAPARLPPSSEVNS